MYFVVFLLSERDLEEVDYASDPSTEPGSEASEAETEDEEVLFREERKRKTI